MATLLLPQVSRTESIRFRVSPEEKAELEQRAGSMGVSAYVREAALKGGPDRGVGSIPAPPPAEEQGRAAPASLPATSWRARVRQLEGQGLPSAAAQRIADQELRRGNVS